MIDVLERVRIISQRLKKEYQAEKVFLFGAYANGKNHGRQRCGSFHHCSLLGYVSSSRRCRTKKHPSYGNRVVKGARESVQRDWSRVIRNLEEGDLESFRDFRDRDTDFCFSERYPHFSQAETSRHDLEIDIQGAEKLIHVMFGDEGK
jgi:hypothetical protein